ncbi:MAG: hypothetical protein WCS80_03740 [Bacilli bacterium]
MSQNVEKIPLSFWISISCYVSCILFYLVDSLAMESFMPQLTQFLVITFLSVFSAICFLSFMKRRKVFLIIISITLSLIKLVTFSAFFFLNDTKTLKLIFLRMSNQVASKASFSDYAYFICCILMFLSVLVSCVCENLVFFRYQKNQPIIK